MSPSETLPALCLTAESPAGPLSQPSLRPLYVPPHQIITPHGILRARKTYARVKGKRGEKAHLGSVLHGRSSGRNLGSVSLDEGGVDAVGERELGEVLGDVLLKLVLRETGCSGEGSRLMIRGEGRSRRSEKRWRARAGSSASTPLWRVVGRSRKSSGRTSGEKGVLGKDLDGLGLVRDGGNELVVDEVDL